ncbi:MAG: TIGR02221 family CRISPR-associated protein [Lutibacter sp.]|nr:TIGR02221 family CRISPR-associated protein [Lutibacter sp.]
MARKVFISVLGSTNYGTCKYEFREKKYLSQDIRFIQEATLEVLRAKDWGSDSIAYICVTKGDRGSEELNWKDNGHKDRTSNCYIHCEGLETRLNKLKLDFEIKPIHIKDGNDKDEIWEVFDTIFKLLKDDDEIYFDITHGFRYLPMLILVLADYSKFLKGIKVKSITYGNYEARKDGIAPIIDITSFTVLQDWTSAASDYVEHGRTKKITTLVGSEWESIDNNKKVFIDTLNELEGVFVTCRSKQIRSGKLFIKFDNYLKVFNKQADILPLKPIIGAIAKTNNSFVKENSLTNVCAAVDWCYSNNLLQQAITMAQELILSVVIDLLPNIDPKVKQSKDFRSGLNAILSNDKVFDRKIQWYESMMPFEKEYMQLLNENLVLSLVDKEIISTVNKQKISYYNALSEIRNKINHGGVTDDLSYHLFEECFVESYLALLFKLSKFGFEYKSKIPTAQCS